MEYKFSCPHCGQRVSATQDLLGTNSQCPACTQTFRVPLASDFEPVSAPENTALPPQEPLATDGTNSSVVVLTENSAPRPQQPVEIGGICSSDVVPTENNAPRPHEPVEAGGINSSDVVPTETKAPRPQESAETAGISSSAVVPAETKARLPPIPPLSVVPAAPAEEVATDDSALTDALRAAIETRPFAPDGKAASLYVPLLSVRRAKELMKAIACATGQESLLVNAGNRGPMIAALDPEHQSAAVLILAFFQSKGSYVAFANDRMFAKTGGQITTIQNTDLAIGSLSGLPGGVQSFVSLYQGILFRLTLAHITLHISRVNHSPGAALGLVMSHFLNSLLKNLSQIENIW